MMIERSAPVWFRPSRPAELIAAPGSACVARTRKEDYERYDYQHCGSGRLVRDHRARHRTARRLYSELFGWEYERHGDGGYHLSYAAQQHLLVCRHFLQAL